MKSLQPLGVALTLVFAATLLPSVAEERTWTNRDGKAIEAEFKSADGEAVTVVKNGKLRKLPLAALSEADQAWVKEHQGEVKPLRVLHLTGGCCHDYKQQKVILTNGIAQRANAVFTTVHEGGRGHAHQYELLKKKGWEKDFDAVLYNICFAREADVDYIESITATHKAGLPAAALHCTMHSHHWSAKTDTWEEFLGVSSRNHGAQAAITMTPTKADHPVMKGFPTSWTTPQGELYNINKVYPSAVVLADGDNGKTKQACVWVNEFGGTRVFGTTVGHHNETMAENTYLDLVTRGLLWATHNLQDDGTPVPGMGAR